MDVERLLEVKNKYGLHARASTRLAQVAQKFRSNICLSRTDGNPEVDGKSILGILTLGAERGMAVRVRVSGDDAADALKAISDLFENNFDEE
jgi:phosphotransferase system HPr (HPr) family protein